MLAKNYLKKKKYVVWGIVEGLVGGEKSQKLAMNLGLSNSFFKRKNKR